MEKKSFVLRGEFIALTQFLKAAQWAQTGGHAKIMVEDGEIKVNGEVELRKRKKLVAGDVVSHEEHGNWSIEA